MPLHGSRHRGTGGNRSKKIGRVADPRNLLDDPAVPSSERPAMELFGEALELSRQYRARRDRGTAEPVEEFLASHPDLTEFLEPLCGELSGNGGGLEPGARIDRFSLEEPVGFGGQAEVWRARDVELDRAVALKVFFAPAEHGTSRRARYEREAHAAAQLRHANIAEVYGHGEWRGRYWIAFEFVDGDNLEIELERYPAGVTERHELRRWVEWTIALTGALTHAHNRRLVHRDVKPSNIMFATDDETKRPVLVDFGVVCPIDEQRMTLTGVEVGSTHYMAPEQALGAPDLDGRADVFGLGVTLYRCLTGTLPFQAASQSDYRRALERSAEPQLALVRDAANADFAAIVGKAIAVNRADRYMSAQAFGEDLERWLRGEPVHARPLGLIARARRAAARHPTLTSLAVVSAVFVVTLVVIGAELVQAGAMEREARGAEALSRAQIAMNVGDWEQAESALEVAAARSRLDVVVETTRAQMELARFEYETAFGRLRALRARDDLGRHRDLIVLLHIDPSLPGPKRPGWQRRMRELADSEQLEPAWRAYARACLAETMPDYVSALGEVIALDGRHRAAHEARISSLLLVGATDTLARHVETFGQIWPRDPLSGAVQGFLRSIQGDADAAKAAYLGVDNRQLVEAFRRLAGLHGTCRSVGDDVRRRLAETLAGISEDSEVHDRFFQRILAVGVAFYFSRSPLRIPVPVRRLPSLAPELLFQITSVDATRVNLCELDRLLGSPALRLVTSLFASKVGDTAGALQLIRTTPRHQDWFADEPSLEAWSVLTLCHAWSHARWGGQDLEAEQARQMLEASIRKFMESPASRPIEDSAAVVSVSYLTENLPLVRRAATWILDRHPESPVAWSTAAKVLRWTHDLDRAFELAERCREHGFADDATLNDLRHAILSGVDLDLGARLEERFRPVPK